MRFRGLHALPPRNRKRYSALRNCELALTALFIMMLTVTPIIAQQQDSSKDNMAGMDMSGDMKDMGPSMAAMAGHMYVTPLRPKQPGDEEKARAVVAQVRAAIERYRDYHKALADGYVIANPKVDEPQFHFNKQANLLEAEKHFDPTRPSSLLYFQTPTQRYKLEGVMFTVPPTASEDELNARIPLSVVRWHKHVKFCAAPADKVKEYFGQASQVRHVRIDHDRGSVQGGRRDVLSRDVHVDDSRVSVRERFQGCVLDERRRSALWVGAVDRNCREQSADGCGGRADAIRLAGNAS